MKYALLFLDTLCILRCIGHFFSWNVHNYFSTNWAFCDETCIFRPNVHFFVVRETTHTDLHKNAHFMFFQRNMHFPDETCISQQNMHFPRCRESSVDATLKWSMFWRLNTMPGTTRRQECRYSQTSTPVFLSIGNADITRPRTRPQREHPHSDSWSILVLDLSTRKGIHDTCRCVVSITYHNDTLWQMATSPIISCIPSLLWKPSVKALGPYPTPIDTHLSTSPVDKSSPVGYNEMMREITSHLL